MAGKFENVIIIGLGLVGGSFAGALKTQDKTTAVYGFDVNPHEETRALDLGLIEAAPGKDGIVKLLACGKADLVLLAAPVHAFGEWFDIIAKSGFSGVVTDVGSTKKAAVKLAREKLAHPEYYVPGHPMAGSEESGINAASAALFSEVYWILTPSDDTDIHAFRKVHELLTGIGARVISVSPEEHDRVVAVVSHVPHIAAAALVTLAGNHAGENGEILRLAAGGFKDTTRIAAGSATLWTGIISENSDVIADGLAELSKILIKFENLIRSGDSSDIQNLLDSAATIRSKLPSKWVPQSTGLIEVRIPMDDRKGIIAEITTAAGRAECNIEAIDIEHKTENRAVLELILTDEGDIDGFLSGLKLSGFYPKRRKLG